MPSPVPGRSPHAAVDRTDSARVRAIIDCAPNAMVVVDHLGRIQLLNALAEQMFGYGEPELANQPVERLIPDRMRPDHVAQRTRYMHAPRPRPMAVAQDVTCVRKDGTEFFAIVSLRPLPAGRAGEVLVAAAIATVSDERAARATWVVG